MVGPAGAVGLGRGWGLTALGELKGGPSPSPLAEEADPCPFSSSQIYNLGTGTGYSVLQMVRAMEKASGREVRSDLQPAGPQAQSQLLPQAPPLPPQAVTATAALVPASAAATGTTPSAPRPQLSPLC